MSANEEPIKSPALWGTAEEFSSAFSSCLTRVFLRMFAALLVTALAALMLVSSYSLQRLIFSNSYVFYALLIAELGLVWTISAAINKISAAAANGLFFLYAIINGLTLSVIFFVYDIGVIYNAFGISALMFGVMAVYGATTRKDLSSIGSLCIMGLIGIILASVLNIFLLHSTMLDAAVCYIGVLIFIGLTAYDTQRIKKMLAEVTEADQGEAIKKISVIGALAVYLDFINLFLMILRIMGRRR
ncbi:MAG: Bax inhibitor-1/YccA family protein [Firmicutes bacterium]|nr:Bax inhibitor-1/YccA family protein [Bacillota bacterium]